MLPSSLKEVSNVYYSGLLGRLKISFTVEGCILSLILSVYERQKMTLYLFSVLMLRCYLKYWFMSENLKSETMKGRYLKG